MANCWNKHSFKQSEWIFSNRDLNVKSLGLIFVYFVQGTKEWTYKQVFILRHVNRNFFHDILKKKVQKSGCLTLLASCLILKERFLRRQMAAYLTRHSECLNSLTITGIPPSSLWIKTKQKQLLTLPDKSLGTPHYGNTFQGNSPVRPLPPNSMLFIVMRSSLLFYNIVWGGGEGIPYFSDVIRYCLQTTHLRAIWSSCAKAFDMDCSSKRLKKRLSDGRSWLEYFI